jgi:hypothetical protein
MSETIDNNRLVDLLEAMRSDTEELRRTLAMSDKDFFALLRSVSTDLGVLSSSPSAEVYRERKRALSPAANQIVDFMEVMTFRKTEKETLW